MRAQLCREEIIGLTLFRKNSEDCNFRNFRENSENSPLPKNTRSTVFENFEKLSPLDHGGPEISWKKIALNDRSHAMDISRITKVILKKSLKNRKKSSICYGPRFSQPKYHIPR